jgi:hypothetical protein
MEEIRRYERLNDPVIFVEFEGNIFASSSWSMGGFLIADYKGPLSSGSLFTISGLGLSAKDLIAVNVRARVVRIDQDNRKFVVDYQDLDSPSFSFLQDLMSKQTGGGV